MDKTVAEIDAMTKALAREGKTSKDDLDWFRGEYRKVQLEEGKRQRQEGTAGPDRQ